jgi:hypothetical protein
MPRIDGAISGRLERTRAAQCAGRVVQRIMSGPMENARLDPIPDIPGVFNDFCDIP